MLYAHLLHHIIHCHNMICHIMMNHATQHRYIKAPCLTPVREPAPSLAPWDSMLYWFHGFLTCSVDEVVVTNLVLDSTAKVSLTHTTLLCATLHCITPQCTVPHCTVPHHTALYYTTLAHHTTLHRTAPHCTTLHRHHQHHSHYYSFLLHTILFNSLISHFRYTIFPWTSVSPYLTPLRLSSRCCCRRSLKKLHGISAKPHLSSAQELSR